MSAIETIAEGMFELICQRAMKDIKEKAAAEGIDLPPKYVEAIEIGIGAGIVHTLLMMNQINMVRDLTSKLSTATI